MKFSRRTTPFLWVFIFLVACQGGKEQHKPPVITTAIQQSNTDALLQAMSVVNDDVVWVSGHKGTYGFTTDGGQSWNMKVMTEADSLQFRDVHAFNAREAILMSAGPGELSQIRKTTDSGVHWQTTFVMPDSLGFIDCMDFWDSQRGLCYGDAIDGKLYLLSTSDSGNSWQRVDPSKLPAAVGSEGGFAASGTCLRMKAGGVAWIGTGAGERPRVLITRDYGENWEVVTVPFVAGEAAGITSIIPGEPGMILGGDLLQPDTYTKNVAITLDGGKTWVNGGQPQLKGAFYGGGVTYHEGHPVFFGAGPKGIDYSLDTGQTWVNLDTLNYWAIDFTRTGNGWALGTEGKILKVRCE